MKPNKAAKKKNERYKSERRLNRNKIRNILQSLLTATGKTKDFLTDRLNFWK